MTARSLLAELSDAGVVLKAQRHQLRLDAPAGVMTPDLLAAVRNCKAPLLEILSESESSGRHADREWDRFSEVAVPTPDGLGLYDPVHGAPEMPSGVSGEDWRALERDCRRLGQESRA